MRPSGRLFCRVWCATDCNRRFRSLPVRWPGALYARFCVVWAKDRAESLQGLAQADQCRKQSTARRAGAVWWPLREGEEVCSLAEQHRRDEGVGWLVLVPLVFKRSMPGPPHADSPQAEPRWLKRPP